MTFGFIAAEKASFPIRPLCRALGVSPSGYYAWAARHRRPRPDRDLALRHAVRVAHAESRGHYGSPRLLRAVRAGGHHVGRNRLMRVMRVEGIRARRARRFVVTTESQHPWTAAPDRLHRRFHVTRPNRCWAADLTYLDTAEGWLYLAVIVDLYSRRVIGWALRTTLHTDVAAAAFQMAVATRRPRPGLIHHSDRGIQYASTAYQRLLTIHRCRASMSRRGDCWDNAVVESFFSTLKQELGVRRWPTRAAAQHDVVDYIERFYNPVRLHSTLNYQSPIVFEAAGVR